LSAIRAKEYAQNHINDALAALWTARRIFQHRAKRIPDDPEKVSSVNEKLKSIHNKNASLLRAVLILLKP
jgi:hypothetical protein